MSAAQAFATNAHSPSTAADQRCFTIRIDGCSYGLPVEAIHTVFEMTSVTPVPLAPREILGLVNLRGKIVTAVSLRRRLKPSELEETSNLAVGLEHRGESFALLVDEVGDVLTLDAGSEIDVPPHLGAEGLKFTSVHRLESQILPILDLDWALTFEKQDKSLTALSPSVEGQP